MEVENFEHDNCRSSTVDITFKNLGYKVFHKKSGSKLILDEQNGTFFGGSLTGIIGSSGAGKSTLLNILAGYIHVGVTGEIYINGESRDINSFKKMSTYIMQENLLQSFLTVKEYIMFAIKLKLSPSVTLAQKEEIMNRVTTTLGLTNCLETRSDNLSGGEKKRLSIATELVNNPPVIFLDEPTTGLDQVAVKQCVELLKTLAQQGKTVICTIHQPSDSVFALFDHVYFMDSGQCTYNNTVDELIPFLADAGYNCPTTYNPADYMIELTQLQPENVEHLAKHAKMRKYSRTYTKDNRSQASTPFKNETVSISIWLQIFILLHRSILQTVKNRTSLVMLFLHHIISAVLIGGVFYGIGKDASLVYSTFKFCLFVLLYIEYAYAIAPTLTLPSEIKIVKHEYFNGWYSLKAYFLARVIMPTLLMIVPVNIYTIIAYVMADQPMEINRYIMFLITTILIGINSTSYGMAIGAVFNAKNGAILTPTSLATAVVVSIYGMGYGTYMNPTMKTLINIPFFRHGIVAASGILFQDRHDLECDEVYCHYKDTDLFLKDMGMYGSSYLLEIVILFGYAVLHVIVGYCLLRMKFSFNLMERMKNLRSYL